MPLALFLLRLVVIKLEKLYPNSGIIHKIAVCLEYAEHLELVVLLVEVGIHLMTII